MSYPRPPFGNRLPSDQNVRPGSGTSGVRLPNPRGRGRGRSQSITESCTSDTRTTNSDLSHPTVDKGARKQACSETRQSGSELLNPRGRGKGRGSGGSESISESYSSNKRTTHSDLTQQTVDERPVKQDNSSGKYRYRHRVRERSQSTQEPSNPDTRTTPSDLTQQSDEDGTGNQSCSETREKGGDLKTLCDFCGDTIDVKSLTLLNNNVYHQDCVSVHMPNCDRAAELFHKLLDSDAHILRVGINMSFLYGQQKHDKDNKTKRAIKIVELLNKASALLNSGSGYIFIHLVGLAPGDRFTGAFDEFADVKLFGLINDGSDFDVVFKKRLLSEYPDKQLPKNTDILVLFVDASEFLVTSASKTKTALGDSIVETPDQNLVKLIRQKRQFKEQQYHKLPIDSQEDLCNLQESRHIQAKACFQPTDRDDKLVSSLFDKLRLPDYISAFTKLKKGGSYLLGLGEEVYDPKPEYKSKRLHFKPAAITDCKQAEKLIKERVGQTVLVCDYTGRQLQNDDLIQVAFIPAGDKTTYTES